MMTENIVIKNLENIYFYTILFSLDFSLFFLCFFEIESCCNLGWPQNCSFPTSISPVLGLHVHANTFNRFFIIFPIQRYTLNKTKQNTQTKLYNNLNSYGTPTFFLYLIHLFTVHFIFIFSSLWFRSCTLVLSSVFKMFYCYFTAR